MMMYKETAIKFIELSAVKPSTHENTEYNAFEADVY